MGTDLQYYTILTDKGVEYEADCIATEAEFHIAQIAVGDGGGAEVKPDKTQTELRNEVKRYNIMGEELDKASGLYYAITQIPAEDGGFTIRELGGYNANGDLVMVSNFPPTEKRAQSTGDYRRIFIRMDLSIVNEKTFPSEVRSDLAFPSTEYVDNKFNTLFELDKNNVKLTGDQTINGEKTFNEDIKGNCDTASKLKDARTITLTGAAEGTTLFDGSGNVSIPVKIGSTFNKDGISNLFRALTADWSRGVGMAANTDHTATSDGYIRWECNEKDGWQGLWINGQIVAKVAAWGSHDSCATAAFVPVKKGDVYRGSKWGVTFYPLIGV